MYSVITKTGCCGSVNVTLTVKNLEMKSLEEKHAVALKLHKQFGHPGVDKLKRLVNDSSINDS